MHMCGFQSRIFSHVAIYCSKSRKLAALAWLYLESDKAAMAHALGAVAKHPPPHAFMRPTAKPKARLPQAPGIASAGLPKKRNVVDDPPCTCKTRRLTDNLTDLDKLLLGAD